MSLVVNKEYFIKALIADQWRNNTFNAQPSAVKERQAMRRHLQQKGKTSLTDAEIVEVQSKWKFKQVNLGAWMRARVLCILWCCLPNRIGKSPDYVAFLLPQYEERMQDLAKQLKALNGNKKDLEAEIKSLKQEGKKSALKRRKQRLASVKANIKALTDGELVEWHFRSMNKAFFDGNLVSFKEMAQELTGVDKIQQEMQNGFLLLCQRFLSDHPEEWSSVKDLYLKLVDVEGGEANRLRELASAATSSFIDQKEAARAVQLFCQAEELEAAPQEDLVDRLKQVFVEGAGIGRAAEGISFDNTLKRVLYIVDVLPQKYQQPYCEALESAVYDLDLRSLLEKVNERLGGDTQASSIGNTVYRVFEEQAGESSQAAVPPAAQAQPAYIQVVERPGDSLNGGGGGGEK